MKTKTPMRIKLMSCALMAAFIVVTTAASAQTTPPPAEPAPAAGTPHAPEVTKRQVNQQERIAQGAKSGELTNRETRHLEAREAKIQRDKQAAKADGTVTPAEKRKLNREENRTSRAIRRQKHDAQTKP